MSIENEKEPSGKNKCDFLRKREETVKKKVKKNIVDEFNNLPASKFYNSDKDKDTIGIIKELMDFNLMRYYFL